MKNPYSYNFLRDLGSSLLRLHISGGGFRADRILHTPPAPCCDLVAFTFLEDSATFLEDSKPNRSTQLSHEYYIW